jgi:hypothetical protein
LVIEEAPFLDKPYYASYKQLSQVKVSKNNHKKNKTLSKKSKKILKPKAVLPKQPVLETLEENKGVFRDDYEESLEDQS